MLRLTGKVDVSQRLTDLKAGQKYALYVASTTAPPAMHPSP